MERIFGKPLITQKAIEKRIKELGAKITADYDGKDVLLVEDIIDSGLTLDYIYKALLAKNPDSLKLCVLLDKAERRKHEVPIEYLGFTIPNKFIIGYGLDYQDKYRNLPYIAILDKSEVD